MHPLNITDPIAPQLLRAQRLPPTGSRGAPLVDARALAARRACQGRSGCGVLGHALGRAEPQGQRQREVVETREDGESFFHGASRSQNIRVELDMGEETGTYGLCCRAACHC